MLKESQKGFILIIVVSLITITGYITIQGETGYFEQITKHIAIKKWTATMKNAFSWENVLTSPYAVQCPTSTYGYTKRHLPPEKNLSDKYIIYKCNPGALCGGLADRQKGIVTAYVFSQMLRRKFGIIMKKGGCDFSKYVLPNEVSWIVNDSLLKGRSSEVIRDVDNLAVGVQLQNGSLEKRFTKDVTYYEGNTDYLSFIMNKTSFRSLTWTENKGQFDMYRIVFTHLFKLAPDTQRKYEEFHEKTKDRKLVCAHLRMGQSKNIPGDQDLSHKHPDPQTVVEFLKGKVTNSSKLFLATDSDEYRQEIKNAFPRQFIDIQGPITHIDRFESKLNCSGMEKAILDQFILSTCDTFLMSFSGFSIVAALLRGSDDELYLARLKNISKTERLHPFYTFKE